MPRSAACSQRRRLDYICSISILYTYHGRVYYNRLLDVALHGCIHVDRLFEVVLISECRMIRPLPSSRSWQDTIAAVANVLVYTRCRAGTENLPPSLDVDVRTEEVPQRLH
jgi:hypothetical protein